MTPTLWLRIGIVVVYAVVYVSRGDSMWLMWLAGMMFGTVLHEFAISLQALQGSP